MFARGANHLWLDSQCFIHQTLLRTGQEASAAIVQSDREGVLTHLPGPERPGFNEGTPLAGEVTLNWNRQQVMDSSEDWRDDASVTAAIASDDDDILPLEPEVLQVADSEGAHAVLSWSQSRPGVHSDRSGWLLRLQMTQMAEQSGKMS